MKRERITLAFFIDALGWRLAQELGCFKAIAPHAYGQRTVLGYSCAAQPTILTGLSPSEHAHWAMFYRTDHSELAPLRHLDILPRFVSDHRRFRRRAVMAHRRWSGFTGYYNLYRVPFRLFGQFDISEKKDIYAPEAFDAVWEERRVESIFDVLVRERVNYRVWSWRTGIDQALAELVRSLGDDPPVRFALLYTAVMDAFLHDHVDDAGAVAEAVADLESKISNAVAKARDAYSEVDVLVFSDHGMARVTGTIDLMSAIESLGLEMEKDYLVFYDSTMARFWFATDRGRDAVTGLLQGSDRGRLLTDEDLRREGVFFDDHRYGEVVFLLDPGTLIVPSYMGARPPKGMHGFSPDHVDSDAAIMSSSPLDPAPSRIADTFAVMSRLLGLAGNRGVSSRSS